MAIQDLWVEAHRPKKIQDYVWIDNTQKQMVESWIKEKSIPHLLLSGGAGTGKCLDGSEEIKVQIELTTVTLPQLARLSKYHNISTATFQLPIKELFDILGLSDIEYEQPAVASAEILIDTPAGFKRINKFVKKMHSVARYFLEDNIELTCSTMHLVFQNNEPCVISKCHTVDTVHGSKKILGSELIGDREVYDVALDFPHQYVTPNGIIHHNTTLAKVLINELGVEPADVLIINASRENGVDLIRNKITNFGQSMPFGEFKIILLDEADGISPNGQAALRGVMEQYQHVLRFIITCNYPHKIIPAIHSRCQGFNFKNLDETEFMVRVGQILAHESVEFDIDTLTAFTKAHYPDLRKTINQCQQCSTTGKLVVPAQDDELGKDYRLEMVGLFRDKKIKEARKLICSQINLDEYEDVYKFLYRNLDFFGSTDDQKDSAVLAIRQGLVNHSACADPEINLSATMIELERIAR